jgi:hypothetical protein
LWKRFSSFGMRLRGSAGASLYREGSIRSSWRVPAPRDQEFSKKDSCSVTICDGSAKKSLVVIAGPIVRAMAIRS